MRLLTERQRRLIREAVRDHHLALIVELCGADAIPAADYERISKAGLVKKLPVTPVDLVTAAHLLGAVVGDAEPKVAQNLQPKSFWEIARHSNQLTNIEHEAIQITKDKIANLVQGMGSDYEQGINIALHEADTELNRKRLQTVVEGLEDRASVQKIAQRLSKTTKDASKQWLRTAHTEVHNAIEEGKAAVIAKLQPTTDPFVYKRPRPDACPYCKLLYLKPNGVPRIFKLSDLMANGTNHGRKAGKPSLTGKNKTEYKAVIGSMHPFCQCELHHLPANTMFDGKGNLVPMVKKSMDVASVDDYLDLLNHECQ